MPSRPAGKLPLQLGWSTGEDGWGGDMNRNLALLSVMVGGSLESLTFNTPPPEAVEWSVYFVAPNPTGPWTGQAGRLAVLIQGAWEFLLPYYGLTLRLRAMDSFVWWDGTQWVSLETGQPAEGGGDTSGLPIGEKVAYSRAGQPAPGERFIYLIDQPVAFASGGAGSLATCDSAPATACFYRLYRNSQEIGTIDFAAGSFNGVFNVPSSVTFGLEDQLVAQAPDEAVTGFGGIAFKFRLLYTGA